MDSISNLRIARKRGFKCFVCGQTPETKEFSLKKTGYLCNDCYTVLEFVFMLAMVLMIPVGLMIIFSTFGAI